MKKADVGALTGVSPLVGLEVGALGVDLVAAGDVAPVYLAPFERVAALAVDDDVAQARAVAPDAGWRRVVAPAAEADARRQGWPLVVEHPVGTRTLFLVQFL